MWRSFFPAEKTAVMAVTSEKLQKGRRPSLRDLNKAVQKSTSLAERVKWWHKCAAQHPISRWAAPQHQHGKSILSNPSQPVLVRLIFVSHSADLRYLLSFIKAFVLINPKIFPTSLYCSHNCGSSSLPCSMIEYFHLSFYKHYCTFHWTSLLTIWTK